MQIVLYHAYTHTCMETHLLSTFDMTALPSQVSELRIRSKFDSQFRISIFTLQKKGYCNCYQLILQVLVQDPLLQILLSISEEEKIIHVAACNLQVLVKEPLPAEAKKSGDSFEDTMLLLDIVRERKKKQNENKKVPKSVFSSLVVT